MPINAKIMSKDELNALGLRYVGDNVFIDRTVRIFYPHKVSIESNTRIDCQSVISCNGDVYIGPYSHFSIGTKIMGGGSFRSAAYVGVSSNVTFMTSSENYAGDAMSTCMVPQEFRKNLIGNISLEEHVVCGPNSVVLPNVTIGQGAAVGALSLISHSVPPFIIVSGNPARKVGIRKNDILEAQQRFEKFLNSEITGVTHDNSPT
jgi:acetyltransferase-like isoleucine patch superfamily enzyme